MTRIRFDGCVLSPEGTPVRRSYRQTCAVRTFVLAVTGRDRPGIVAAVTRALLDHGLNIEDAEMAILRGHFAVMLMLAAPDALDEGELRAELEQVRASVPLETVALTEVPALDPHSAPASHAISVYGADHPGIVHGVTEALAGARVNVVGLSTRVLGEDEGEPIYVMLLEVALPDALDEGGLDALLARVAEEQGVDVSVRAVDGDVL
jgi:glycine cleavage system transcriptional repressor